MYFRKRHGLAKSPTAKYYAIKSIEEARQYLNHPILGARLWECAPAVLARAVRSASEIFGAPDDLKLKSLMTLFAYLTDPTYLFVRIIDKYFDRERDVSRAKKWDHNNCYCAILSK